MLNWFNVFFSLSSCRSGAGDVCLFHPEPRASDFKPIKTETQRRRATEPCPHRLACRSVTFYHLVTWNEKLKSKEMTHTVRAHSHWDRLWRLTRTAVAPRSCFHTCVLRLTRVRARQYARMSVSRVCIMFRATAYASFSV